MWADTYAPFIETGGVISSREFLHVIITITNSQT